MFCALRFLRRSYSAKVISTTQRVALRPYQEACLQACTDALALGDTRIGVSLPTGSGKTTVFVSLISRLPPPPNKPNANRALIIVNTIELARQVSRQVEAYCPDLTVEIEQGQKHNATGNADVTIATYQTLLRPTRISKFNADRMKVIVVDEAHHAAAPSYRRILAKFDPDIRSPDVDFKPPLLLHRIPIIGFSATFSRHDGLALGSVFQKIVFHKDFLNMIAERWLCNVRFTSVKAQLDLRDVTISSRTGDYNPTSLAHVVNTETVNNLVVQSWLDKARSRKSTLVFCVSLDHLQSLTDTFRQRGIDARYIYAATPAEERKALVAGFRKGEFPVLLNVAILTEGADIPNIDCLIVARPTRSRNVFAQMIGRGMRLSPETGKEDCHIIDFVDSSGMVNGVVSIPTLFGVDPDDVIGEITLEELRARADSTEDNATRESNNTNIPTPDTVSFIDYDNPFALVQGSRGAPHITKLSRNAWVGCGGNVYVLECLGKGHIRIHPKATGDANGPHFEAHFTPAMLSRDDATTHASPRFLRRRRVLTANTLDEAVRGCDSYAKAKVVFGNMALGLLSSANWRRSPASQSQRDFLSKRLNSRRKAQETDPHPTESTFDAGQLTKGEAANIITRLKHGAQSRYTGKARQAAKGRKIETKERARKEREVVEVGPLRM
ncbi:P-loop containing nucleoside triphosphate hydrolase protein [Rickenella mellea]|uniref:P-loop containing nucleoside triphosphate hydrolase protein n=1 Tax=Rickenella mellea TaxID=50990 RepID=A0A4Y7QP12_9AGAM|nr:P-loop containing nucleoside triphosphate hydrolase protein [Rickenella mellea]